jgi:centrosomal protein CEP104
MSFKLVKLPFSILAVSGHDENFPADGLVSNLEWQSDRFCIFPQSIILSFDNGKCRVKKIQLLLHEYKIPREIEFFPGIMHDTGIVFKSLGVINLDDNSLHSYRSRELKSIHVDFEATHLKISLQKNYINTLNLYNQVI